MGMQFVFKKVTHFSRLLKAGGRLREFNFRKLTDLREDGWFHVDVADDRGDRIIFRLSEHEPVGITPALALPEWVRDAMPQLYDIIKTAGQEESLA
jgi:hypothetical protein